MSLIRFKLAFFFCPLLLSTSVSNQSIETVSSNTKLLLNQSRDAYVILMNGNDLIGARVLGQSLLDTKTMKDRVAMCTDNVHDETKKTLQADGWVIKNVSMIPNPCMGNTFMANHFYGTYSKLHAWNLTEYERIVYLDLDVLVVSNIDHLFDCGTFCAPYRNFGFITSVMVIEPSNTVFNDLTTKATSLQSYNHKVTGFLNLYYKDFIYASMFNWNSTFRQYNPMRLPSELMCSILHYQFHHARVDTLKVVHFAVDQTEPWFWWALHIHAGYWKWFKVRERLDSCDRTSGFVYWAPYPLTMLLLILWAFLNRVLNSDDVFMRKLQEFNSKFLSFIPMPILCLCYSAPFLYIVPTTMTPILAEYVFWLWSSFFLLLFIGTYCCLSHVASKLATTPHKKLFSMLALFAVHSTSHLILAFGSLTIGFLEICDLAVCVSVHGIVSLYIFNISLQIWANGKINSEILLGRSLFIQNFFIISVAIVMHCKYRVIYMVL